jgi:hypothetical protein
VRVCRFSQIAAIIRVEGKLRIAKTGAPAVLGGPTRCPRQDRLAYAQKGLALFLRADAVNDQDALVEGGRCCRLLHWTSLVMMREAWRPSSSVSTLPPHDAAHGLAEHVSV